jgi:fatty acid omega-hydroxylase
VMTPEAAWAEAMRFENRANPFPFFDELRRTPVARVNDDLYVVTGYRELRTLLHDPRLSADASRSPLVAKKKEAAAAPSVPDDLAAGYAPKQSFIASDPPDHDRMRRQVMWHFAPPHSPGLIPGTEPDIQRLCSDLFDKVKAKGENRFDVVDDYAYPVPVSVICKIMGVPVEDEPTFHAWIFDLLAGVDLSPDAATEEGQARAEKGRAAGAAFQQYLRELIDRYAREPGQGLISSLLHDDGPDGPMSPEEVVPNASLMFIAGHDSTVNTIAHCVLTTLRNPGSLDLLRSRPELIPRAIEETLRLQSAVQFFPTRSAAADIEVGGTVIPAGAAVILLYGAANRDPMRFPNPNQFDPEREDNQHVGWGGGIHSCVGGPLARLEVNLAFENFIRRVENPRLVEDPPPYRRSPMFRGPQHLWVEFDRITD